MESHQVTTTLLTQVFEITKPPTQAELVHRNIRYENLATSYLETKYIVPLGHNSMVFQCLRQDIVEWTGWCKY